MSRKMLRRVHYFSLPELLVSIAVFLLIMVMTLQFFAATQKIWSGTRSRGDVFIESKAGLDFAADLLSQAIYHEWYNKTDDTWEKTYFDGTVTAVNFVCRSETQLVSGDTTGIYMARLYWNRSNGTLNIAANSAQVGAGALGRYTNAMKGIWVAPSDVDSVILERVTDCQFVFGDYDSTNESVIWNNSSSSCPDVVMLRIGMLNANDYQTYLDIWNPERLPTPPPVPAEASEWLADREMTFSRIVYFNFAASRGNLYEVSGGARL